MSIYFPILTRTELGKNLNTDEAPALGAVYQAAFQSKGYKVKRFYIKDANIYPVVVDFERHHTAGESESSKDGENMVRRTLFDTLNPFPQKKVMTFGRHTTDFGFSINYGNLDFLSSSGYK
jgi:hypoxia up-regulated 1